MNNNIENITPSEQPQLSGHRKIASEIYDFVEIMAFATCVVVLVFTFIARLTIVVGPSMENTLIDKDYLIVSDLFYTPKNGDIITIHNMTSGHHEPIVKRVIATSGQTIDIDFDTWVVKVDDKIIDEPYAKFAQDQTVRSDWHYPITVPENCVFVMGDNRNHSSDSRSSSVGMVDVRHVMGKVIFRIMPINKFGIPK